jgi:hypothetical protein
VGQATFEPSRRFLGCHGVRRHLQQLGHERIGTLALALEVRAVAGRQGLDLGQVHSRRFRALPFFKVIEESGSSLTSR